MDENMVQSNLFFGCPVSSDGTDTLSRTEDMLEIFQILKPKPSSCPLIRIGGNKDGSYLVPDDLTDVVACFSPGVNNSKDFEDFLVERYRIPCHMCDYSSDIGKFKTPLKEGMQTFRKKWLDVKTEGDSISLDDWVAEEGKAGDLLLQIDIEGAEYRNLLAVSDRTLRRFRVVVMEVHRLDHMKSAAILRDVVAPFFKRLATSLTCVHAHPNNSGGEFLIPGTGIHVPNTLELTFVRNDRLDRPQYAPLLPHPLDISRNVRSKPPLILGEEWLDNPRPLESRVKVLEDRLDEHLVNSSSDLTLGVGDLILKSLATATEKMSWLASESVADLGPLREVAKGRPFVLSAAHSKLPRNGVVDGKDPFFFHTATGINQFIKVDLGEIHTIVKLSVSNRLDMGFHRARMIFTILSTNDDLDRGEVFYLKTPKEFLSGRDKECEFMILPSLARFVTFISPIETALHFSDLKVYATS